MYTRRSQYGFTLIELMVVIAIASILIGIAAYSFRDFRLKSALRESTRALEGDIIQARMTARARQETVRVTLTIGAETPYVISLERGNRQLLTGRIRSGVKVVSVSPDASFTFNGSGMTGSGGETVIVLERVDSASTGITDQYRLRISTTGLIIVERSLDGGHTWSKAW